MDYATQPGPSPEAQQKRAAAVRKAARQSLRKTVVELEEAQASVVEVAGQLTALMKTLQTRVDRVQRDLQRLDDSE